MKNKSLLKNICFSLMALSIIGLFLSTIKSEHSSAAQDAQRQAYHARLREGVGNEVRLPLVAANRAQIEAAVESVAAFIENRAGVVLTAATKDELVQLEQQALANRQGISVDSLVDILTDVGLARLSSLSDAEIATTIDIMRDFNAADLPELLKERKFLRVRASHAVNISEEKATEFIKSLRDKSGQMVLKSLIKRNVRQAIDDRLENLSAALPLHFRQHDKLTPLRVFLLTYSVAADDYLADSFSSLQESMYVMQDRFVKMYGSYPSPAGYYAYGVNGYIFSSPLNYFFDEQTQAATLNRIAAALK
jgi:hypothetical protein